jgi:chromosome segregation ATPase
METAELSTLDQQIAELQAQRHQQLKATEAKAKINQEEQLAEKMKAANAKKVEHTREYWPNGAVILKDLLDKQYELHQVTKRAKELTHQVSERRTELKGSGRQLIGREQQQFADLEQRAIDATQRKNELERAIQSDTTLKRAFATDHSKQLQSVLKTLEKAATELEDLAKVEEVMNYHPHYTHYSKLKLPKLLKQIHEVADGIEKY